MARRTRFIRGGRSLRETIWIGVTPVNTNLAAAGTRVLVASLNAAALALRPFTIVRTHLAMFAISDQAATTESFGVGVAMAVVNDAAVAAGVGSVPTPYTNQDSDLFFIYSERFGQFQFFTAAGVPAVTGLQWQMDSKAMRKVNNDQDIALVVETPSVTSNGAIIHTSGRMLLKLH